MPAPAPLRDNGAICFGSSGCNKPNHSHSLDMTPATHKVGQMNSEQLQSLAVLALAMVPVALLWWLWIRMLA
jgi:hypothetical protein